MLPPDNFQETPHPVVAQRTSPTNIGVYLLSVVSARDFGWISLADAAGRIEATMATIEKMERHRGHLYNWYDTKTLRPLYPLYVSSVDSGNLAGHLVAVAAACAEWAEAPSVHLQGDFDGMLDCVTILDESLAELPDDRRQLQAAAPAPARPHRRHAPRRRDHQDAAGNGVDPHHQPRGAGQRNPQAGRRHPHRRRNRRGARCWPTGRPGWRPHAKRMSATRTSTTRTVDGAARRRWSRCSERDPQVRLRDGLLLPHAEGTQAPVDRLPRRGAPARRELLRPAGIGSAADQPVRHRQGRSADRALVPARPADRRDRLPRRADVVVRLDVRISDAAAGDEGAAGRHPQPDQPSGHQAADPVRPLEGHPLGHFGSRLQCAATRR